MPVHRLYPVVINRLGITVHFNKIPMGKSEPRTPMYLYVYGDIKKVLIKLKKHRKTALDANNGYHII